MRFVHDTLPQRVCFGSGQAVNAALAAEGIRSLRAGLHHKICHVLGGTYNLPHAQTHAAVLPYVLAFNGPAAPAAERRIAAALDAAAFGAGRPSNPRPVTVDDLRALLRAAWSGADPRTVG